MSQAFFPIGCVLPNVVLGLIATVAITFLTFINCYDVRGTVKLQNIFLFSKITPLVFIILAGIVTLAFGNYDNVIHINFENSKLNLGDISFALYYGFFSYAGWQVLYSVTEELKNPNRYNIGIRK